MTSDTANQGIGQLVEACAFALFGSAQQLERFRLFANIAVCIAAALSLIAAGYALYLTAIIAFVACGVAAVLRLLANRRLVLGHSLHRISMLAKAYRMNEDCFDVGYLLSKVPARIHSLSVEAAHSPDPSGNYSSPTDDAGPSRLRWMIQENAFFNASLYDECADHVLRLISAPIALLALFALVALPVVGGATASVALRAVLAVLSLAILYDQIERWASWRAASRIMLDLENELARFKSVPDHRVLLMFSNYQVAISGSPAVEPRIYRRNRDKLNAGWKQRVATLNREWSDVV